LFHVAPEARVTRPVNSFAPKIFDMIRLPLVPPPIVVVPPTVNAKPAAVKVFPSPMLRLPVIVRSATVVALAVVPPKVRLPSIVLVLS